MRSRFLAVLALSILALPAAAERIGLALVQVDPIGVSRDTARIVEEILQAEFARLPMFRVVERDRLGALLQEQQLQLSGVTNAETAVRAGNVLNVQKVVFGSIGRYQSEYLAYILSLRLVDVERGVVEASENTDIGSDREIRAAAERLVARIAARVSIAGKVASLAAGAVYTNLGTDLGVRKGDLLAAYRVSLVRDSGGRVVMREDIPVANLEVDEVSEEGSRCRVLEKAGEIVAGLSVKPGRVEIANAVVGSGLTVTSIPENSRVFLDSEFIGVTPVSKTGIKPGSYTLEIRGSGYKPYLGRVNLTEGRTVTLERELEQVVEVEDMILMGEVPRKQTDPKTAFLKALVPGGGMAYNGYSSLGSLVAGTAVMGGIAGGMGFVMDFAGTYRRQYEQAKANVAGGSSDYEDRRWVVYGPSAVRAASMLAWSNLSLGIFPYVASLVDAPRSAKDNFLYPVYSEVALGGGGGSIKVRQTADSQGGSPVPAEWLAGASSPMYGVSMDFIGEARKFLIVFGISQNVPGIAINASIFYRVASWGRLLPGIGLMDSFDLSSFISAGSVKPAMQTWSPALSLSWRGSSLEADLFLAPIEQCVMLQLASPAGAFNMIGYGVKASLDLRWFLTRTFGFRILGAYKYMMDTDPALRDAGFSTLDYLQVWRVDLGTVFRF